MEAEAETVPKYSGWCEVNRNTETDNIRFFGCTGGILKTQELFPMAYFTHNPTCSWTLGICRYTRIQTYFGSVTAKIVGFCGPFAFCIKIPRLATFSIAPKNCIFEAHLLSPLRIWRERESEREHTGCL